MNKKRILPLFGTFYFIETLFNFLKFICINLFKIKNKYFYFYFFFLYIYIFRNKNLVSIKSILKLKDFISFIINLTQLRWRLRRNYHFNQLSFYTTQPRTTQNLRKVTRMYSEFSWQNYERKMLNQKF